MYLHIFLYICRKINLLGNYRYDKMMTALISIVNDAKRKFMKQGSNNIFNGYDSLTRMDDASDWDTFKGITDKVSELLAIHKYILKDDRWKTVNPLTMILIHQNAQCMITKMLPEVCFIILARILSSQVYNAIKLFVYYIYI